MIKLMLLRKLKIAIVCDWLTNFGGAEKDDRNF